MTCQAFPIVVITSNGARSLPAAFVRRCIHLELKQPGREKLTAIVRAHIGLEGLEKSKDFMDKHAESFDRGDFTTGQFLNAIYLVALGHYPSEEQLSAALLQPPGTAGS